MTEQEDAINALFRGKDLIVREIYNRVLEAVALIGSFQVEPKQTSIDLVHHSAFAALHPRTNDLTLSLRMANEIDSPRVQKTERVSTNRTHNEITLTSADDVDAELIGWIKDAYERG